MIVNFTVSGINFSEETPSKECNYMMVSDVAKIIAILNSKTMDSRIQSELYKILINIGSAVVLKESNEKGKYEELKMDSFHSSFLIEFKKEVEGRFGYDAIF